MEVSILNEREQVFKGSSQISAPLQNFTELKEREVSYYKSSDEAPKCDDFVDMYEEDYVEVDEVGINIPAISKCPTKYFAVEALLGELETPYQKQIALANLGIDEILEQLKQRIVILSQEEYDALEIKNDQSIYFIKDDD